MPDSVWQIVTTPEIADTVCKIPQDWILQTASGESVHRGNFRISDSEFSGTEERDRLILRGRSDMLLNSEMDQEPGHFLLAQNT